MASLELRNGIWHLRYRDRRGLSRSQSTHIRTSKQGDALALKKLAAFQADQLRGKNVAPASVIGKLLDDVIADYSANGLTTIRELKIRIENHLRPWFDTVRADKFGADDWREYVTARQAEGAANGTINLEREHIVRGFNLAYKAGKLDRVPYVPKLKQAAPRSGSLTSAELESLCRHLPAWLDPIVRFAFHTGWRLMECRSLQWRQVDFVNSEIRLDVGSTKNEDGRVFPMTADLHGLLAPLNTHAAPESVVRSGIVLESKMPTLTPFVFNRSHKIYKPFARAARAIGKPGLVFHDLRRSAIINFDQQGVPPRVAMALVGHRTMSMWMKYRGLSKSDMDAFREKMDGVRSVYSSERSSASH